jgi:hypothetical protein
VFRVLRASSTGVSAFEAVQVVDIDVIGSETAEAGLARLYQMIAGGAKIIGPIAHGECSLGRNENRFAAAGSGLAQDFFGCTLRINVGRIEEIHSRFEADIDQAGGFLYIAVAPAGEKPAAAEGPAAEAENRNL